MVFINREGGAFRGTIGKTFVNKRKTEAHCATHQIVSRMNLPKQEKFIQIHIERMPGVMIWHMISFFLWDQKYLLHIVLFCLQVATLSTRTCVLHQHLLKMITKRSTSPESQPMFLS